MGNFGIAQNYNLMLKKKFEFEFDISICANIYLYYRGWWCDSEHQVVCGQLCQYPSCGKLAASDDKGILSRQEACSTLVQ